MSAVNMLKRVLGVCALMLAVALPAMADDKKPTTPPKAEEKKPDDKGKDAKAADAKKDAAPDMSAMMAEMEKAAQPGPQHEALKPLIGSFKAVNKFWMDPAAPPQESTGTIERKAVLGNRYIQEDYTGSFMGKPFNGIGFTGYDNMSKKYVVSWMDTWSTGIMTMTGTADASGKVFTYMSDQVDPMSGMKTKSTMKIINNDKHVFEMFMVGNDGKDVKTMEMECTRK